LLPDKHLLIIAGPTAVGKTEYAIKKALELQTIIVSADSRQFYRETNIGTAKPTADELNTVPHYFINSLSIFDNYNVGDFERDALALLNKEFLNRDHIVMAGGSGLYIKAICEGLDTFPPIDESIRPRLQEQYEQEGIAHLQNLLQDLDPHCYAKIDQQNPHRLLRALEVCIGTGKPYSSFLNKRQRNAAFNIKKTVLYADRELLYQRINKRVDAMIQAGLEAEARQLYPHRQLNALQTVGYQELFDHFDGKYSFAEAVELIKRNTRRYAKRQLTWFRHQSEGWEWVKHG
jgi:tRNA dimethylallyltransferase